MNQAAASAWVQEAARGVVDVIAMLRAIVSDPRVSQAAKIEASAALAYLASGRARIPRFVPVAGRLDDVAVAAFALKRLLTAAGEPVLRSHWRGSERGLDVVLTMAAALASPGGRLRRLAVVGAAANLAKDRFGEVQRSGARRSSVTRSARRPGLGKVLDGEVLARREERR